MMRFPWILPRTCSALFALALLLPALALLPPAEARADHPVRPGLFDPGPLSSQDSTLKVHVGDAAPDFALVDLAGKTVRLSDYRGQRNVLLSFVPAAWTPVCSGQWPGYNLALKTFEEHDTIVLGLSVDNRPTLFAWTEAMHGIDFPVLSDFWPHGRVADLYGVLRSDGMSERALFLIDKQGVVRFVDVHDINKRPDLGKIMAEVKKLSAR
ncbi:MAG: peroxiredoxin [Desulfovibrio sp.]|jgi:peroxiredoxin (alkyl hydroperoxide reductase subunit C)|nr:peroxiredoxin [Desulfovibrio sp.]